MLLIPHKITGVTALLVGEVEPSPPMDIIGVEITGGGRTHTMGEGGEKGAGKEGKGE